MTPFVLGLLRDPVTREALDLSGTTYDPQGRIVSGTLTAPSRGVRYPIVRGIPRFASDPAETAAVESFGDQWNHHNFVDFKQHWLQHTVASTFGSTEAFRGKVIVDAGGGSGAQTRWMLESGARHVILLELSHSVDDVVTRNLGDGAFTNYDVIQCSIDAPPLAPRSIDDMVLCHNVIQHTPSVERTAHALYDLVAPGGELVFNCYGTNDATLLRWIRFHLVFMPAREILRRLPFGARLAYARLAAAGRLVPGLGTVLEKATLAIQGDVPREPGESMLQRARRRYAATALNTFDAFGSHAYQHYKSEAEIRALVKALQPDAARVGNLERYYSVPPPIGCAIRVQRA